MASDTWSRAVVRSGEPGRNHERRRLGGETMRAMRAMRPFDRLGSRETGAIAVLMAIAITVVLVPLGVYGVDSYVRSGVYAEEQRAADAGALAGAARIPLADPGALSSYLQSNPPPRDPRGLARM